MLCGKYGSLLKNAEFYSSFLFHFLNSFLLAFLDKY